MGDDKTRTFGSTPIDRRRNTRHAISLDVDYQAGDTYLYSKTANISEMGIFLLSDAPHPPGTVLHLRFAQGPFDTPLEVRGEVVWIDPGTDGRNGGMGIRFLDPDPETRLRIRTLIRTMAYID